MHAEANFTLWGDAGAFLSAHKLVDQRLNEGTQLELGFKRRPALRAVLAAGVVAASFIIQPAHANHCSPQFEQLRAQSAAARSTATAAIDRNDYRTACGRHGRS
ncbi:hypothetical protein [Methylocystis sp.]|uniref:hypothetical protein n=1 Tax=Methylocystis sp. TaxID=1911079 RepID=UPI003DA5FF54